MGGKSSSSSSSSTTTIQTDGRIAATDNASVFTVDGNENILTDFGSIEKAGELAFAALNSQSEIALKALEQTKFAVENVGNRADSVLEFVDQQNRDEDDRTLTDIVPYLLVGVSVLALTGSLKIGS